MHCPKNFIYVDETTFILPYKSIVRPHAEFATSGWCPFKQGDIKEIETSISANAEGPHDAVSCKIDHIALPTEYNYQAKSVGQQKIATPTEKCRLLTQLNNNAQTQLFRFAFYIL